MSEISSVSVIMYDVGNIQTSMYLCQAVNQTFIHQATSGFCVEKIHKILIVNPLFDKLHCILFPELSLDYKYSTFVELNSFHCD